MILKPVIGLEFHVQLKTKSKMFCACPNTTENPRPNENICPICLGHPGVLPQINAQAVNLGIKAALALNCQINNFTKFDRKNYFYPDLPKGYQISQYDKPLAEDGYLVINNSATDGLSGRLDDESQLKRIGIIRLHLEEDSAKSTHEKDATLIDFDRGGAPLIEIVTAPHLSTPAEAKTLAQELQLLMRHLDVSAADMEKGELRCDANISLRPEGHDKLYPKTEIKNINSFRALEKALQFEIARQTILWKNGQAPEITETRGWDETKQATISQRTKEGLADYRYFPEPDLPPLTITPTQIEEIRSFQPELPQAKRRRFMEMYGFKGEDAKLLTENKELANFVEQIISELKAWLETADTQGADEEAWAQSKKKLVQSVANWLINKYLPLLQELDIVFEQQKISAENFAELLLLLHQAKINSSSAQLVLRQMALTGADPSQVLEDEDLGQMNSDTDLSGLAKKIIKNYPEQAAEYRAGKEPLIKFFLGLLMKESKGKANPQKAEEVLKQLLK